MYGCFKFTADLRSTRYGFRNAFKVINSYAVVKGKMTVA